MPVQSGRGRPRESTVHPGLGGVTSEPPQERPGEPGAVLGCTGGLRQPAGQRGRQLAQTLHGTPQATGRTWGSFSTNQSTSMGDRLAGEAEVRAGATGAI